MKTKQVPSGTKEKKTMHSFTSCLMHCVWATKERRPLIVCHRETPLSLIDIENMRTLALAGAIVCPTNPGFYLNPTSVQEIVDFIAGKVLDLLHVEHDLKTRWEAHHATGD